MYDSQPESLHTLFPQVAELLDFTAATRQGSKRNDLAPPRTDDNVGGGLEGRFSKHLKLLVQKGRYFPSPAYLLPTPKPGSLTRPAALLTLEDRVFYEGIVAALRPQIELRILGREIVYWPRGVKTKKAWPEFERSASGASYIALSDISSFYSSIDHEVLCELLVKLTGENLLSAALGAFLGRIMGAGRGLPQGLEPSDPLSCAYLDPLDRAMIRQGIRYARHGDDIRVAADSYAEARQALFHLEREARSLGLELNAEKTLIMRGETYRKQVTGDQSETSLAERKAILKSLEGLAESDELEGVLLETGLEQLGWDLFYHESISLDEALDEIVDHLDLATAQHNATILEWALEHAPHSEELPLGKGVFHVLVTKSLRILEAAHSELGVGVLLLLTASYPEKTEVAARYLRAVDEEHQGLVVEAFSELLSQPFQTPWELSWWLYSATTANMREITAPLVSSLRRIAGEETSHALCRALSAICLARFGHLEEAMFRRLANVLPPMFQADITQAAILAARSGSDWAETYLKAVSNDPVSRVVIARAAQLEGEQAPS